jgi:hypothetical protein
VRRHSVASLWLLKPNACSLPRHKLTTARALALSLFELGRGRAIVSERLFEAAYSGICGPNCSSGQCSLPTVALSGSFST